MLASLALKLLAPLNPSFKTLFQLELEVESDE